MEGWRRIEKRALPCGLRLFFKPFLSQSLLSGESAVWIVCEQLAKKFDAVRRANSSLAPFCKSVCKTKLGQGILYHAATELVVLVEAKHILVFWHVSDARPIFLCNVLRTRDSATGHADLPSGVPSTSNIFIN